MRSELSGRVGRRPAPAPARRPDPPALGGTPAPAGMLVPGLITAGTAVPLALAISLIGARLAASPERAVLATGVLLVCLAPLPLAFYFLGRRRNAVPATAALVAVGTVTVLALAISMSVLASEVAFPGDFLVWSESDFVNDIIKLRAGYPLFTAQVNNESFTYPPGAQLLTYFFAWLAGAPTSVAAYRVVQAGFTVAAALVAVACARRITAVALGGKPVRDARLWSALWLPILLLFATNPLTNAYVLDLHGDGLAQLVTVVAFWLMLRYAVQRERWVLVAMALVPALGFLVKQSLVIWGALYVLQLALFDRPRSWRRVASVALGSAALLAGVVLTCYALWGDPFIYWIFVVLGSHGVSPLRSLEHVQRVWPYFGVVLLAALLLLDRERTRRVLLGPWLAAFALLGVEAYSSGIAWMLNHMGPGTLLAGIWFVAALTARWAEWADPARGPAGAAAWLRPALAAGCGVLLLAGLGLVRIPLPSVPRDARRYAAEIEREFRGEDPRRVLLDVGSWVYLPSGVVMKDRAPSIGERGYSGTGDFSGILQRIRAQGYARILVRNYHEPDFWYDHGIWSRSSGIRAALDENYREVRTIPAVRRTVASDPTRYTLREISVLEPRTSPSASPPAVRSTP